MTRCPPVGMVIGGLPWPTRSVGSANVPSTAICASDVVPRTLRLRIPAGTQRAWVLIGGQGAGTQPVRLTLGQQTLVQTDYIEEAMFQWFGFTLDGDTGGKTVDLTVAADDGRNWRLAALVVLQPGL